MTSVIDIRSEKEFLSDLRASSIYLSIFLASFFTWFLLGAYDFDLQESSRLYISRATIDGVDVSKRVSLFYKGIFLLLILIPAFYLGLNRFLTKQPDIRAFLSCISVSGIILLIAEVAGAGSSDAIMALFYLLGSTILIYLFRPPSILSRALPHLAISSVLITAAISFLTGEFSGTHASLILLSGYVFLIAAFLLAHNFRVSSRSFFTVGSGLSLIPILLFLSTEIAYATGFNISPQFIFSISFGLGLIILIFIRKRINLNASQLNRKFLSPAAVTTLVLFTFYHPLLDQPHEMFELANPANAQMRFFQFGEFPFIDFLSSHVFAEQFYGFIYHFIFGYSGSLDFMAYEFLYFLLFFLLAYFFLTRVLGHSGLALLFVFTFPYLLLFVPVHLFYSILPFYLAIRFFRNPGMKQLILLGLTLIGLVFWRLDTGIAALFAIVPFLLILFITGRKTPSLKTLLQSAGILLLVALIAAGISFLVRSPQEVWNNFLAAYHYVVANQAHGYSAISTVYDHHFYKAHLISPLIAVGGIFATIFFLSRRAQSEDHFLHYAALFFYLIFLANFPRGLVRHGFVENLDSFLSSSFYLANALFILSLARNKWPYHKFALFSFSAFLLIFLFKYFPLYQGPTLVQGYFTQPSVGKALDQVKEGTYRGRISDKSQFAVTTYDSLKTFLDSELRENQTFLDFSNTPMLYYYCQRRIPSYFCQSLQNTVDDYLQLDHLRRIDPVSTPFVVYSHVPPNWFDATDGVPNAMRQYLIAEYIYRNYLPLGTANGYSIWKAKEFSPGSTEILGPEREPEPQVYDYGFSASHIYRSLKGDEAASLNSLWEAQLSEFNEIILPEEISSMHSLFLRLGQSRVESSGQVLIELFSKEKLAGSMKFNLEAGKKDYLIPLSNHYLWHKLHPDRIRISGLPSLDGSSLEIVQDLRHAN